MAGRTKVLITGANGTIGRILTGYFATKGLYELVLMDAQTGGDASVIAADLSIYDQAWASCFVGVDVVVHLAADPRPDAPWESLVTNNIDTAINVYRAVIAAGTNRVVYASTIATSLGYEDEALITPQMPTRPKTFYAATKIMAERLGKSYSEQHDLSVICLRIGASPRPNKSARARDRVSDADLCQGFEKAIAVQDVRFAILNLVSDNPGMPWDLSDTRRLIGYDPRDAYPPDRRQRGSRIQRLKKRILG